jgi:hypothetical protein
MLAVVLAGWTGVRLALWESPFPVALPPPFAPVARTAFDAANSALVRTSGLARAPDRSAVSPRPFRTQTEPGVLGTFVAEVASDSPPLPLSAPERPVAPLAAPRVIAGHQFMMLAAFGRLGLPSLLALDPPPVPRSERAIPAALVRVSRWSGDGWVLLRRGFSGLAVAPGFARYGSSQGGAVLRYALAPASSLKPQAQLRLTRAIGSFDEGEVAAGLSVRPFGAIPVRLLGEGRVQRTAGHARVRPTLSAASEIPPVGLPYGAEGEVYAAAGYVGGKDATPFFDAQITAERPLLSHGPAELRIGAGAWAGGQEGGARLDLGPRASVRLRFGDAASRLALDWRFRVAGNAAPASGPALTFSAGF